MEASPLIDAHPPRTRMTHTSFATCRSTFGHPAQEVDRGLALLLELDGNLQHPVAAPPGADHELGGEDVAVHHAGPDHRQQPLAAERLQPVGVRALEARAASAAARCGPGWPARRMSGRRSLAPRAALLPTTMSSAGSREERERAGRRRSGRRGRSRRRTPARPAPRASPASAPPRSWAVAQWNQRSRGFAAVSRSSSAGVPSRGAVLGEQDLVVEPARVQRPR